MAATAAELQRIGRGLTPAVKTGFTPTDLERVRRAFGTRLAQLQAAAEAERSPALAG